MLKKAFSLSEVLMVVGIIGVVASLTLPNLMNKSDETKTVVQLRKVYNELNSGYKQTILRYGNFSDWGAVSNSEIVSRYYDFLDVRRTNVNFPVASYNGGGYYKCELNDGTILSSNGQSIFVALGGYNGINLGEHVFAFNIDTVNEVIRPFGYGVDKAANGAFTNPSNTYSGMMGTNWAIVNGNLDYLKCASSLNWVSKLSCK